VPDKSQDQASAREQKRIADGLRVARILASDGVPIFRSTGELYRNKAGKLVWPYPTAWQKTKLGRPSIEAIEQWKPGLALCALMGVVLDAIDVDAHHGRKLEDVPRSISDHPAVGLATTPSGGWHLLIPCIGMTSWAKPRKGIDFRGGLPDGNGRGFIHIAPTIGVSKVTGRKAPYRWELLWGGHGE
jgi:hypothetical protein